MNEVLPEMKHFILAGGHSSVSITHIARCVCRRAERCCVNLDAHDGHVDPLILNTSTGSVIIFLYWQDIWVK